jgi:hypothetical protein
VLKIITIYQIIIWSIGAVMFFNVPNGSSSDKPDMLIILTKLLIVGISIYVVYLNICLLLNFRKAFFKKNLIVNKWINFIQIFHISLLGLNLYLIVGNQILLYYSYEDVQKVNIGYDLIRYSAEVTYVKNNIIVFGINLMPLMVFLFFSRELAKHDKALIDEIIKNFKSDSGETAGDK